MVVLQPREAKEVGAPLTVRGYTRVSKDTLEVSLLDREREVISSKTVRVGGRTSTWEFFETTLEFSENYEGLAILRVVGTQGSAFTGTETQIFLK